MTSETWTESTGQLGWVMATVYGGGESVLSVPARGWRARPVRAPEIGSACVLQNPFSQSHDQLNAR
jgi:hypothetical protein